jgi:hypothetical protein
MDGALKIDCGRVNIAWYEGFNLLLWTNHRSLPMTLVPLVKRRYTYWFSKTTMVPEREKVDEKQCKKLSPLQNVY